MSPALPTSNSQWKNTCDSKSVKMKCSAAYLYSHPHSRVKRVIHTAESSESSTQPSQASHSHSTQPSQASRPHSRVKWVIHTAESSEWDRNLLSSSKMSDNKRRYLYYCIPAVWPRVHYTVHLVCIVGTAIMQKCKEMISNHVKLSSETASF